MKEDISNKCLTIHLEGVPADGGDVRIGVFSKKLDEFRLAFEEAQHVLGDETPKDDLLVRNLTHNSPAAITLSSTGDFGNRAFLLILDVIKAVQSKQFSLAGNQINFFTKLRDFCKTNYIKLGSLKLSMGDENSLYITKELIDEFDALLMPIFTSLGSVKGIVQGYNSHSNEKYFYLYPQFGTKVKCLFEESMLDEASAVVEKSIIVHGMLKYRGGEFSPYEVSVSAIEINPANDDLPSLTEAGVVESINSELNSVALVKEIRNGW